MSQSRLEWKVGLFVLAGLILAGLLLLQFSKGASLFKSSYKIVLQSTDVNGLKRNADVLMAGVKVGSVSDISLAGDGKSVAIQVTIYSRFQIFKDAKFSIQQAGFLGDQYIAVTPEKNQGGLFQDGDKATAEPPFNLQEMARSASGLVEEVKHTAVGLNGALNDLRKYIINPNTMTNLSVTVENLRQASDKAVAAVDNLNQLLETNSVPISQSASNLVSFSTSINKLSGNLTQLVDTNSGRINNALSNVEASTVSLRNLMAEVEQGKGLAGALIKNEQLPASVSNITRNLSITTSNLNKLGLWGIMWRAREPRNPAPAAPAERLAAPKDRRATQ